MSTSSSSSSSSFYSPFSFSSSPFSSSFSSSSSSFSSPSSSSSSSQKARSSTHSSGRSRNSSAVKAKTLARHSGIEEEVRQSRGYKESVSGEEGRGGGGVKQTSSDYQVYLCSVHHYDFDMYSSLPPLPPPSLSVCLSFSSYRSHSKSRETNASRAFACFQCLKHQTLNRPFCRESQKAPRTVQASLLLLLLFQQQPLTPA